MVGYRAHEMIARLLFGMAVPVLSIRASCRCESNRQRLLPHYNRHHDRDRFHRIFTRCRVVLHPTPSIVERFASNENSSGESAVS